MLIQVLVGGLILFAAVQYYVSNSIKTSHLAHAAHQNVLAEFYAAELAEGFRALESSANLKNYFQKNPVSPTGQPYYTCAHINVLDRSNGKVLNPDPAAKMPPSPLDGPTEALKANRYYQVQVVDASTLKVDPSFCDKKIDDLPVMSASHRFLVSVGVSWVPDKEQGKGQKNVALSALLPY